MRRVDRLEYSEEHKKLNIKQHDTHCTFSVDSVKRLPRKLGTQINPLIMSQLKTVLVAFKS